MFFRAFLILLFAALTAFAQTPAIEPGVSHDLARWRAVHYGDVRYKLNLTLEKMSPVLKGTIEIAVEVDGEKRSGGERDATGPLPTIILDWRKIRGSESLSTVSNVSINGKSVVLGSNFRWPMAEKPAKAGTQNEFYEENEHLIFSDGVVQGENVIQLDFTSPILTSGSALTRYVDRADGAEYIYSLFVPSDASTAFPVFDQPDLKARFGLRVVYPKGWLVVSNTRGPGYLDPVNGTGPAFTDTTLYGITFEETKPISTYVFAFAAGPWEQVSEPPALAGGTNAAARSTSGRTIQRGPNARYTPPAAPTTPAVGHPSSGRRGVGGSDKAGPPTSIYVRKSQAPKFKPHAAEVFRLNREGIKFLETYFDYKFPFPKYDIVLIPEFPFGGMEHAGATFLREDRVIFPQEPTKNDYITRANVIFHEAAHQWFGDTVTMRWFDDLWLKEGFAEFMAYKTLEKVMPEYNAWKVFYERNKQAAYLTDSTKGTTPIYQEIANLSAAKSAYGNIVYRKAPSFLKQAEFYIGPDKFQTAVRAFLKKHEFGNAGWEDLVKEFEAASKDPSKQDLSEWAEIWVKRRGVFKIVITSSNVKPNNLGYKSSVDSWYKSDFPDNSDSEMLFNSLAIYGDGTRESVLQELVPTRVSTLPISWLGKKPVAIIPNYQDYGYGIFLLDDKSRDYVLKNIQNEKDDFLRSMMWGSLWDSVREAELDPKEYVELVVENLGKSDAFTRSNAGKKTPKGVTLTETDESTIQTLLGRVSTAMNYYLSNTARTSLAPRLEDMLIDRIQNASTPGQRITYYRVFLNIAASENARRILKIILKGGNLSGSEGAAAAARSMTTKDKFDIVTRLMILGDAEAPKLLAELERAETSDEAKRYAYAARAGLATAENKAKYWTDFTTNKDISESWIEAAFGPFNSIRHSDLTLPHLEKALAELPNLKRNRKIFFVNGWLGAFIGGQKSEQALGIVNKFLADNPNLDRDLRLKILENVDLIERAVKIRGKYAKN